MLEYKVCFHISYWCPWTADYYKLKNGKQSNRKRGHGKLHYAGYDLEEAVAKVRGSMAWQQVRAEHDPERGKGEFTKCTSMWVMRGRQRGLNVKWDEYHKKGEAKKLWKKALVEAGRWVAEANAEVDI